MTDEKPHFMEHPEVVELIDNSFPELVGESDRGAVIIGADIVDSVLYKLFDELISSEVSKKKRKRLFDYTGPLGTFSSKNDMALAVGYINKKTHDCINVLREIRNDAAHSNVRFDIKSQQDRIREMYNVGDGVPIAVRNWAFEHLMKRFVTVLMATKDIGERPIFKTLEECLDYIVENPDSTKAIDEKLPVHEFSLGLILLCAFIIHQKESCLSERKH
ncbi:MULTISPECIES: hypothetical protein [unclassified Halomonas]|uniref:hypothetical protein n=1 Tax=unclassified Halomonas TaxID=2609666 RepID=UPI0009907D0F|nr:MULTISPECIES: hypothetical protein [unclassified Halomonas]AQU82658.1 hypothetical protein B2G49_08615 [Halomonas sp. 'Soap Lake \